MKRVGAVLAAVAMVVIAIAIRGAIDDDGDGGGGGGSLRLVCATELRDACEELDADVTIEDAGETFTTLIDPDTTAESFGFDGWLSLSPYPDMAIAERDRLGLAPVLESPTDPIARSPLVVAVRAQRETVLGESCEGPIRWPCLGDQSGRDWAAMPGGSASWGTVRVGHANPITTAVGLVVLGQATSEFFGDRIDLNAADLDTNGFVSWLNRLEDPGTLRSFADFLTTPTFDVVGTTEAEAGPALAAAAADVRDDVTLLYLEPVVTADVVFAATAGRGDAGESLEQEVTGDDARQELAGTGWRVDGQDRADGIHSEPALPRTSGLPTSPGFMYALQRFWTEVT